MKFQVIEVRWSEYQDQLMLVRNQVFVVEQEISAELELDEWDPKSRHVLLSIDGQPVGTGRLLPDGHIGRVAILKEFRGLGLGQGVMRCLMSIAAKAGFVKVELSSQLQASSFYGALGFAEQGDVYLEAGIEHISMVKEL